MVLTAGETVFILSMTAGRWSRTASGTPSTTAVFAICTGTSTCGSPPSPVRRCATSASAGKGWPTSWACPRSPSSTLHRAPSIRSLTTSDSGALIGTLPGVGPLSPSEHAAHDFIRRQLYLNVTVVMNSDHNKLYSHYSFYQTGYTYVHGQNRKTFRSLVIY